MVLTPAAVGDRYRQTHASLFGELKGVRQQVFEHLLQTFRVGYQTTSEMWIGLYLEAKPAILGLMTERAGNHIEQAGEEHFLRLNRHCARFDLRQIEDVADQVEQIRSRAVNRTR